MKCDDVRAILTEIDDEDIETRPAALIGHLKQCSDCRRFRRGLSETWKMLDCWRDVNPPDDFRGRFWQRVERQQDRRNWLGFMDSWVPRFTPQRATAVATLLLTIFAGGMLMVQNPRERLSAVNVPQASDLEDEQLLASLSEITQTVSVNYLEIYDTWEMSGDEIPSLSSPGDDHDDGKTPGKARRRSDESSG